MKWNIWLLNNDDEPLKCYRHPKLSQCSVAAETCWQKVSKQILQSSRLSARQHGLAFSFVSPQTKQAHPRPSIAVSGAEWTFSLPSIKRSSSLVMSACWWQWRCEGGNERGCPSCLLEPNETTPLSSAFQVESDFQTFFICGNYLHIHTFIMFVIQDIQQDTMKGEEEGCTLCFRVSTTCEIIT